MSSAKIACVARQELPAAVTDIIIPPAVKPKLPESRPARGGHKVAATVRRELFEATKKIVEFLLQVPNPLRVPQIHNACNLQRSPVSKLLVLCGNNPL